MSKYIYTLRPTLKIINLSLVLALGLGLYIVKVGIRVMVYDQMD
jgi:hypothetical protein